MHQLSERFAFAAGASSQPVGADRGELQLQVQQLFD